MREWEKANAKENAKLCEFLAQLPPEDKNFMGKVLVNCFGEEVSSKPKEFELMHRLRAKLHRGKQKWQNE